MKTKVTAIFDIGKTNKKFFLFDTDYHEVYREYINFEEIKDEDGYPTENLQALVNWAKEVVDRLLQAEDFEIVAMNFSCYGASLVHVDESGKVLGPLYNYQKPLNEEISNAFYAKYGPEELFSRTTGSQKLGMLNTGMQLYWLKHIKPKVFAKIKYSLHLPQYLSYIFTGVPVSEYTSIGCHTCLWDYNKNDYHTWVYQEGIDKILPPIENATKSFPISFHGKKIRVGAGIHDSSAALLPYVRSIKNPFVLVSTGTWSISINPFSNGILTDSDIQNDCIFNMQIDGTPVKVSRLFLGNEYQLQVAVLAAHYNVPLEFHKSVTFDRDIFLTVKKDSGPMFKWISIAGVEGSEASQITYARYEHAYHRLMLEFVALQVGSIRSIMGAQSIDQLYIDGGFTDNEVFVGMLAYYLEDMRLYTADSALGSALGAAIVNSNVGLDPIFLKDNYSLKEHLSPDIK